MQQTAVPIAASQPPKARVRRWKVPAALAFAVLAICGGCALFLNAPQRQFLRATAGADQLELVPTYPKNAQALLVVRGPDAVAEFVDLIKIEGGLGVQPCKCTGDIELRFHRAGNTVATIGLAHGDRLKWRDAIWGADRKLTDSSRIALQAWLVAHDIAVTDSDGGVGR